MYDPYGVGYYPGPTMVGSSVVSGQSKGTNIPGGYKSEVSYQGPVVEPRNLWAMNAMLARRGPAPAIRPPMGAPPSPRRESAPEVQGDAVLQHANSAPARIQKWQSFTPDGVTPMSEYVGARRNSKDIPAGLVTLQEAQALNALLPANGEIKLGESAAVANLEADRRERESNDWQRKIFPGTFGSAPIAPRNLEQQQGGGGHGGQGQGRV